jgi:hypothetical protein
MDRSRSKSALKKISFGREPTSKLDMSTYFNSLYVIFVCCPLDGPNLSSTQRSGGVPSRLPQNNSNFSYSILEE